MRRGDTPIRQVIRSISKTQKNYKFTRTTPTLKIRVFTSQNPFVDFHLRIPTSLSWSYTVSDTRFRSYSQTSDINSHAGGISHPCRCSTATAGLSERIGSSGSSKMNSIRLRFHCWSPSSHSSQIRLITVRNRSFSSRYSDRISLTTICLF